MCWQGVFVYIPFLCCTLSKPSAPWSIPGEEFDVSGTQLANVGPKSHPQQDSRDGVWMLPAHDALQLWLPLAIS